MKKLTTVLLTSLLLIGTTACSGLNKTSANAPNTMETTTNAPTKTETRQSLKDARSQIRRQQLNGDIRAREQRNNFLNDGSANNRFDSDLQSEVRDKLEANIPGSELTIDVREGVVTIVGTVPAAEQLTKIEPLAEQIKGVREVNIEANVVAASLN